ncbi:MAG TPA: rod shape-determining protein MreD [Terriglobia bacterium]|nr:rod shape-determining protein MreD [Terriglobia bacterium]
MRSSTHRPVAVYQVHPAIIALTVLASLLLQTFLPLRVPLARLIDLPLLIVIYFALMRRDKVFAIALGAGLGLLQDALSHGYIGIYGIAKAIVAYLAASASTRFELESLVARTVLTGVFILVHNLCLAALQRILLETPWPYQPFAAASAVLINVALGLIIFQLLDRIRQPA